MSLNVISDNVFYINDSQRKFIKWAYENHYDDLPKNQKYVLKLARYETLSTLQEGYRENSDYQIFLNLIRIKYIREYNNYINENKMIAGNTNKTITSPRNNKNKNK